MNFCVAAAQLLAGIGAVSGLILAGTALFRRHDDRAADLLIGLFLITFGTATFLGATYGLP